MQENASSDSDVSFNSIGDEYEINSTDTEDTEDIENSF